MINDGPTSGPGGPGGPGPGPGGRGGPGPGPGGNKNGPSPGPGSGNRGNTFVYINTGPGPGSGSSQSQRVVEQQAAKQELSERRALSDNQITTDKALAQMNRAQVHTAYEQWQTQKKAGKEADQAPTSLAPK